MKFTLETAPDALRVEEAAAILGISRNSAYDAIRRGEIRSIRIGKRLIIPKSALIQLLVGK